MWVRTTSVTVIVIFSKVPFWKFLGHSYTQYSFSTSTKQIVSSILKDVLELKILRIWINIRTNLFIKIRENLDKVLKNFSNKNTKLWFLNYLKVNFCNNNLEQNKRQATCFIQLSFLVFLIALRSSYIIIQLRFISFSPNIF